LESSDVLSPYVAGHPRDAWGAKCFRELVGVEYPGKKAFQNGFVGADGVRCQASCQEGCEDAFHVFTGGLVEVLLEDEPDLDEDDEDANQPDLAADLPEKACVTVPKDELLVAVTDCACSDAGFRLRVLFLEFVNVDHQTSPFHKQHPALIKGTCHISPGKRARLLTNCPKPIGGFQDSV
jgi:hypothetical protein